MKIDKFDYKTSKSLILDTIDELKDEEEIQTISFTSSGYYNNDFDNIEPKIELLIDKLKKVGIDLKYFMEKYKDDIYKDYDFVQQNAFFDCLLYWFDEEEGILSGCKLIEFDDKEYFIKYGYGYYNYDMGKRFIYQFFKTLDDYYEETAKRFLSGMFYDEPLKKDRNVNDCSLIKKYGKGYTIYVNLKMLFSQMNYNPRHNLNYDKFMTKEIPVMLGKVAYRIFDNILEIYIGYRRNPISIQEFNKIQNELDIKYQANKYNL